MTLGEGRPASARRIGAIAALVGASLIGPMHLPTAVAAPGVIEGTVFRDWNQNGVQDPASGNNLAEPGVAGIEVVASDAAGTVAGPATSGANGHYSISLAPLSDAVSSTFRVEFTIPAGQSFLHPGPVPAAATIGTVRNKTSVQFSKATGAVPAGTPGADFGVAKPTEYCQANPKVAASCFVAGIDPTRGTVRAFDYDGTTSVPVSNLATQADTGAVWGLAWDRTAGLLYEAAFTKRYAPFGPGGPGGIYATDYRTNPTAPTSALLLTIPAGPDPHVVTNNGNSDPVWGEVGHVAFGDIDLADDDSTLYVVNLFDRRLHLVDLASASVTGSFDFPDPGVGASGCPLDPATPAGELNRNLVPGGLKVHDGVVYVGMTCTAERVAGTPSVSSLRGFVYSFGGTSFAQVANFSFNYSRFSSWIDWQTWVPTEGTGQSRPQPWLTDIEFDDGGFMIVGIADRYGHQSGRSVPSVSAGDILRLIPSGTGWTLESNGSDGTPTGGAGNSQGPGGGEFYFEDTNWGHADIAVGGLAQKVGRDEVLTTVIDPVRVESGGVHYYSNSTGKNIYGMPYTPPLYVSARQEVVGLIEPQTFGKATSMGDLELLCDAAPVQIGNRAWLDLDGDGIQDPEEPPLRNVTVELRDAGGAIVPNGSVKTDSAGNYAFTIEPDTGYSLRFDTSTVTAADLPSGYNPSPLGFTQADAGTDDAIDSDVPPGATTGTVTVAAHAAGHNDHTFDAGVIAQQRLGNLVWNDLDDDGKVDAGEPGIGGVTVELWRDGDGDGILSSGDSMTATTTTATNGAYHFTGLSDGRYFVAVPAGQAVLAGLDSSTGSSGGVADNDDNGAPAGGFASVSGPVSMQLAVPHPLAEKSIAGADDEAAANAATGLYPDNASDLTVDLGFFKRVVVTTTSTTRPTTPTSVPGSLLSRTGNDPRTKMVLGGWLVWFGVGLVVADRRRRRRLAPPVSTG